MSQYKKDSLPFHLSLSKQVAEQLRRGTSSWLVSHENSRKSLPYNPITGKTYTAINNMLLSSKGYKDNRWLTFEQAKEQGCAVKKGEKATDVVFYSFTDRQTKERLAEPKAYIVKVFNAEQLTGIENAPDIQPNKEEVLEKVKSIFANSQVKIVNNQKDKTFYRSKDDTVYMPPKEAYKDELVYCSAVLHEFCRWAGNGGERLNFPVVPFGTEAFAREKLRTEMAVFLITKELGIPYEPQGQQFAGQWADIIEKDPFELLKAAKDAEKIKGFVMKFENALEKELVQEIEPQEKQNIAEKKTYLAVPYDEKDEAKKIGAKWEPETKSWYAEQGKDLNLFAKWRIDENTVIPAKQETLSPEAEFTQYLRDCGLDVDKAVMDGQIHRVPLIDKPGGKDGAYCGYLDGIPSGWVQNYVTGEKSTFISTGVKLSEEEKARQRAEYAQKQQEREERRKAEHDNAANKAVDIYLNAQNNPQHAYLEKKGIQPYCAKINHYGQLVIPMENTEVFRGVQFINEDGSKQFLPGIEKKGSFAVLNSEQKELSEVLVCEGFATGASLHEATKLPVIVAFDAGNLEPVAKSIHDKFKSAITICADNDQHKENNVGLEYAQKAALAVGGKLAVPQFTDEEKAQKLTDFNDLHKSQGLEAVKRQVSQAKLLQQNQTKTQNKQLSR